MLNKSSFFVRWFIFTYSSLGLIILISFILYNNQLKTPSHLVSTLPLSDAGQLISDQGTGKVISASIDAIDGRQILIQNFLKNTPMEEYANLFITLADKYSLDYRLVPSIAMCESNLGKRIPSSDSYNAWGIGVYSGQQHGASFNNWETAIEWVYNYIYNKYIDKNITDIYDIGSIWAPPSIEKGNSWANCVKSFMDKIE